MHACKMPRTVLHCMVCPALTLQCSIITDACCHACRSVLLIQSTWRMLKHRRAFLKQRRAAVAIQARVKGTQARAAYAQLRKQHAAATAVQACFRGHQARQHYLLQRDAAVAVQMGFRRRQVSNTLCLLLMRSNLEAFVQPCFPV